MFLFIRKKVILLVFERIISTESVKKNPLFGFVLGLSFSLFAMVVAIFVFPRDPALVTVGVSSLLLVPLLREELVAQRIAVLKGGWSIKNIFVEQWNFFLSYFFLFLGMFSVFSFFSIMLPSMASSKLFETQLSFIGGAFSPDLLIDLIVNNFIVLVSFIVFSIVAGSGSIFLLSWNASVWGTVFGVLARTSAENIQGQAWILYVLILVSVLPHMILEVSSYIFGIMGGVIMSESLITDGISSKNFDKVVKKCGTLLIIAVVLVLAGAIVETYVLDNFIVYQTIIGLF